MSIFRYLEMIAVYGIWFGGITLIFFVPLGFHHDLRLGAVPFLSFLYLDGEGMSTGGVSWQGYQVHFSPFRLVITLALWIGCLLAAYKYLRYLDSKRYVS
jgi:hypothetical protein